MFTIYNPLQYTYVAVRPYRDSDFEAIVEIERLSFPVGAYSRRMLRHMLNEEGSRTLVYEDGRVLGYITAIPLDTVSFDVESIAVLPEAQGRGIGRQLLSAVEELMAQEGFTVSILEVREKNSGAIRFYQNMGYRIISFMPKYYREEFEGSRGAYRMLKFIGQER
ncbi:ribosomal-protein-alanine acetyltransferase [Thermogymnomonas acidicola]|uniref:Ribosomal-protein-alanine acetyltransferase n=1 Tax=Thermogymnomonas acidicola TaxID=399579 RepID=A0AA37FAN0_9ARCH|nr:ribosomal-protein-alanine acetyltransferase [Thermogymnomonas acidicola]